MVNWHFVLGGLPFGPVQGDELEKRFKRGQIGPDTLVWAEHLSDWQPLKTVPEFFALTSSILSQPLQGQGPQVEASHVTVDPPIYGEGALSDPRESRKNSQFGDITNCVSEPPIPWSRYFARMIDVSILSTILLSSALLISPYISAKLFIRLHSADVRVLFFFLLPLSMIVNGIIATIFGNTIGKKIFGIHVIRAASDRPLTLIENISRELRVWSSGMAFGIPLVCLFTMIPACRRLNNGIPPTYDVGIASVRPYHDSNLRRAFGICLALTLMGTILVTNNYEREHLRRIARPYEWVNPSTGISATIPGGWENETDQGPTGPIYYFTNLKTGIVALLVLESSSEHDLVSYAGALETALSDTMVLGEWSRHELPGVWRRSVRIKEGELPGALLLKRVGSDYWRLIFIDQMGSSQNILVEDQPLTRALFESVGTK